MILKQNFLLEPLAACHNTSLVMYSIVNTAFTNYIDQFNLTEDLQFPILINKTTSEYTLLIFLNDSRFDACLLTTPHTKRIYCPI